MELHEKIAKINTQNADLEVQLEMNKNKLAEEEKLQEKAEMDSKEMEKVYNAQVRDQQDLAARMDKIENELRKRDMLKFEK